MAVDMVVLVAVWCCKELLCFVLVNVERSAF